VVLGRLSTDQLGNSGPSQQWGPVFVLEVEAAASRSTAQTARTNRDPPAKPQGLINVNLKNPGDCSPAVAMALALSLSVGTRPALTDQIVRQVRRSSVMR
jgi:hypothetical protein